MKKYSYMNSKSVSIEKFDLSKVKVVEPVKKLPVTFWLPDDYKLKFGLIQNQSKNEFGKHIQKMIMSLIDSIDNQNEVQYQK